MSHIGPKLPTCVLQAKSAGIRGTPDVLPTTTSVAARLVEANDVKRVLADINAHRGNGRD
jgi:hypothetical protein